MSVGADWLDGRPGVAIVVVIDVDNLGVCWTSAVLEGAYGGGSTTLCAVSHRARGGLVVMATGLAEPLFGQPSVGARASSENFAPPRLEPAAVAPEGDVYFVGGIVLKLLSLSLCGRGCSGLKPKLWFHRRG